MNVHRHSRQSGRYRARAWRAGTFIKGVHAAGTTKKAKLEDDIGIETDEVAEVSLAKAEELLKSMDKK